MRRCVSQLSSSSRLFNLRSELNDCFKRCGSLTKAPIPTHVIHKRHLSISEAATALRPFYFVVHPDLFGRYPEERAVNEESLKKLHEYISSLQQTGNAKPIHLDFYTKNTYDEGLTSIRLHLMSMNIRDTITLLLQACELPLDYIDTIPKGGPNSEGGREIRWDPLYYKFMGKENPYAEYYERQPLYTLLSWLEKNTNQARKNRKSFELLQQEVTVICDRLIEDIGLESLDWHVDWGINRFMGCLRAFDRLYQDQKDRVRYTLRGRSLVFSNRTGVSLLGEVVLNSSDVPLEWLIRLSTIRAYDTVLERLPYMERELSELLGNIQVVRRKKKQILMADEYELLLNKILNSLRRCQDDVIRELGGRDLSALEMVVEGESAPLTLSNLGQFLIPASMPGSFIIKFIADRREGAYRILRDIHPLQSLEKKLLRQCKERFQFDRLHKDENISPTQIISCCKRLLEDHIYLEQYLSGSKVRITCYYSVMTDGEMCIPWDWKSDFS